MFEKLLYLQFIYWNLTHKPIQLLCSSGFLEIGTHSQVLVFGSLIFMPIFFFSFLGGGEFAFLPFVLISFSFFSFFSFWGDGLGFEEDMWLRI